MKTSALISALLATSVAGLAVRIGTLEQREQLYTIETAPGETKQVTEAEKWALRAVSFFSPNPLL